MMVHVLPDGFSRIVTISVIVIAFLTNSTPSSAILHSPNTLDHNTSLRDCNSRGTHSAHASRILVTGTGRDVPSQSRPVPGFSNHLKDIPYTAGNPQIWLSTWLKVIVNISGRAG